MKRTETCMECGKGFEFRDFAPLYQRKNKIGYLCPKHRKGSSKKEFNTVEAYEKYLNKTEEK